MKARTVPASVTHYIKPQYIPQELRERHQWVIWKCHLTESGKITKVPYQAEASGIKAASDNPTTWADFGSTYQAYLGGKTITEHGEGGIGYVFSEEDPYFGFDADACIDPETEEFSPWAKEKLTRLSTYSELSVSSTGAHAIGRGRIAGEGRGVKTRLGEIYDRKRFFAFTGQHLSGTPKTIENRQAQLEATYAELAPARKAFSAPPPSTAPLGLEDEEVLEVARGAKNGAKFRALYDYGDLSEHNGDHSTADFALCSMLRFYVGNDAVRIDRLFRGSSLRREKWDKARGQKAYGEMTIDEVIERFGHEETYSPPGRGVRVTFKNSNETNEPQVSTPAWPKSLREPAFHGLAGELVRLLEPHTEADVAALLFQFLAAFGSAVGREAHYLVESDKHHANINVAITGNTAKGRKGTSYGRIAYIMELADSEFPARVVSGLSSGEGLIWAVRDPIMKLEAIKDKGKDIVGYQEVIADEGVKDKRLLVMEAELASPLKVLAREGNTLSAVVRNAWDTGTLRTLTKNSPAVATNAHISIIGHITKNELLRQLDATEMANGFANRFLFVCVHRSKALPFGGDLDERYLCHMSQKVRAALEEARKIGRVKMSDDTKAAWAAIYSELSEAKPGLFGSLIARSEAQVLRLALLYTLLDGSRAIELDHLEAGLACWDYCEASARYLFGENLGNPMADTILKALRGAGDEGMSRTDINALFKRHATRSDIDHALGTLADADLAYPQPRKTSGRPLEVWYTR